MPARKNLDQLDTSQIYFVSRPTQVQTQNRKIFDDMVPLKDRFRPFGSLRISFRSASLPITTSFVLQKLILGARLSFRFQRPWNDCALIDSLASLEDFSDQPIPGNVTQTKSSQNACNIEPDRDGRFAALHCGMMKVISCKQILQLAVVAGLLCGNGLRMFAQIVPTGVATDLAINGAGWFVVRDPVSGDMFVTRFGGFNIDSAGFVVTDAGLRLQGFADGGLTTRGDLVLDNDSSTSFINSFHVAADGTLVVGLSDGTQHTRGQVLLQQFQFPDKLTRASHRLYWLTTEAGPLSQASAPGSNSLGVIVPAALDITPEPVRLSLLANAERAGPLAAGVLTPTESPTDLGISGPGFFLVRETNSSALSATRAGMFLVDGDGYLETYDGLRVQGFSDADLTLPGDVRIDETGALGDSSAWMAGYYIEIDGSISVRLSDGSMFTRSRVRLFAFQHPELLVATPLGRYAGVAAAGPMPATLPLNISSGHIRQASLELINVPQDLIALRRTLSFFDQGFIQLTNSATCVAIAGTGFFQVKNPTNGQIFATRRGDFHLDGNDFLVTAGGLRVQGFNDGNLTNIGDLLVNGDWRPATADPKATLVGFSIDWLGQITILLTDGSQYIRGQILLQNFREPYQLRPFGDGLYTNASAAQPLALHAPGSDGSGSLISSALEDPVAAIQLTPPARDGFRMRITGEPGNQWTLQAADDLQTWKNLQTWTNAPDEAEFSDAEYQMHPRRFYRVVVADP